MASALSEDEFHRLQLQLLELRTANYELDGKTKKLERELVLSQEQYENLDKELTKANKVINKSKKTKELESLIQENETLQHKLHNQEEEFRLQNQTLMQELTTLVATNEKQEKELTDLRESTNDTNDKGNNSTTKAEAEIRRLQAQNSTLQKNLTNLQEKYERDVENGSGYLPETKREPPVGIEDRKGSDEVDLGEGGILQGFRDTYKLTQEINYLRITLNTESEEKKFWMDELSTIEKKLKDEIANLQSENDKLNEKFKKKQESFMAVHKEKEEIFAEGNKKVEELQASKERDQKYYQEVNSKLQKEIDKLKQTNISDQSLADQKVEELEKKIATLQTQVDAASIVGNQQLQEHANKYQIEIVELRNKLTKLIQENDDLKVQLQESQKACEETIEHLHAAQHERDSQIQALQEVSKVAENRKCMLDEMAIKYQKEDETHRETVVNMEEKHKERVTALQQHITDLQNKAVELEKLKIQHDELQINYKSVTESKSWLERSLKETEESLNELKLEKERYEYDIADKHDHEIKTLTEEHQLAIEKLLEEQQTWQKGWEEKENMLRLEIENLNMTITSLHQQIKDGVGDKRIHEKKGLTMIKDLKKQLHAERKKTEKLQERLQEVLTDSKDRQSMEELFRPSDPNDSFRCDTSSVSSWSASGNKDSLNSPQSPSTTNRSLTEDLEQEYGELLTKMGGMQQTSWQLEEKVAYLEMSNACMAEDLLRKTAIIEHYVMESKIDHRNNTQDEKLSLKKVLDLVNKGDDHELREMNKKLQNMVEETLTKNMHLQNDLEMMSNEVVRLSKLVKNGDTPTDHMTEQIKS